MKQFNELPESVKNEIKDTLKAYNDVYVFYEMVNIILVYA